jgi:hypothetical protein
MSYPRAHGSSGEEGLGCAAGEIFRRRIIVNINDASGNSSDAEIAIIKHNCLLNLFDLSKDLVDKVATSMRARRSVEREERSSCLHPTTTQTPTPNSHTPGTDRHIHPTIAHLTYHR